MSDIDPMMESKHHPDCRLADPCRSNNDGDHIMQGTVAGIPVSICGMCMDDCICDRLKHAEQGGYLRCQSDVIEGRGFAVYGKIRWHEFSYKQGHAAGMSESAVIWATQGREQFDLGYIAGLTAARDAVAALDVIKYSPHGCLQYRQAALAAIDALKGNPDASS